MYTESMSAFGDAMVYYERYVAKTKAEGKKPVSFFNFICGRY